MRLFSKFIFVLLFSFFVALPSMAEFDESEFIAGIVRQALPEEMHSAILDNIDEFQDDLAVVMEEDPRFFTVVDKSHLLSEFYDPGELVFLDGKGILVNKKGMKLEKVAFDALKMMISDASKNGLRLIVSSAYRDYKYQVGLYNYYVSKYGKAETDTFSAPPGASQHQLGTVVDFNEVENTFAGSKEEIWLKNNACKYGFSLSFPKGYEDITGYDWESWHFRYVTPSGAAFQKKYFNDIQHYMLLFLSLYRD